MQVIEVSESRKVATCGLLGALAVVEMLIGSLLWVGIYAVPLLSIWTLLPVLKLYGRKASFTAYVAVAVLALILVPDRELSLFYCCFGWWPAVRPSVQKIHNKTLRLLAKLLIYIASVSLMIWAVFKILGIPEEGTGWLLTPIAWLPLPLSPADLMIIAAGALLFLFCDVTLDGMADAITKRVGKLMRLR